MVPKKDGTKMAPSTLKSQWWNWVARQKIDPHLPIAGLRGTLVAEVQVDLLGRQSIGPDYTGKHVVQLMGRGSNSQPCGRSPRREQAVHPRPPGAEHTRDRPMEVVMDTKQLVKEIFEMVDSGNFSRVRERSTRTS